MHLANDVLIFLLENMPSTAPSRMVERTKRCKIRPLKEADEAYVWKWFQEAGWHAFGWATWKLAYELPSCRQWVAVDENGKNL